MLPFRAPLPWLTAAAVLVAAFTVSCGPAEETVLLDDAALAAFADTTDLPRLVYPGDLLTLNDRCPVRKSRLNPRMPAIWVNEHPVGFC